MTQSLAVITIRLIGCRVMEHPLFSFRAKKLLVKYRYKVRRFCIFFFPQIRAFITVLCRTPSPVIRNTFPSLATLYIAVPIQMYIYITFELYLYNTTIQVMPKKLHELRSAIKKRHKQTLCVQYFSWINPFSKGSIF